jgi:hypothetical protein
VQAGYEAAAVKEFGEQVVEASKRLHNGNSIDILASMVYGATGAPVASNDPEKIIKAAFSTHSVVQGLGDTITHLHLAAYREAPSPWRSFAKVVSAKDFRTQNGLRPNFPMELLEVGPDGEIKHGTVGEETYDWRLTTKARMLGLTRQELINGGQIFADVVPELGKSAARSLNDAVVYDLTNGTSDFFSVGNGNLVTTVFGASALHVAIATMRSMRDVNGNDIDIVPRVLFVPPALEGAAKAALESEYVWQTAAGVPTGNTLKDMLTLKVDSRLSNTTKFGAGATATAWYLLGAPMDAPIVVAFLNGKETPVVETNDQPFNLLGVQFRVYFDYDVAHGDYRAAYKSTGAGG